MLLLEQWVQLRSLTTFSPRENERVPERSFPLAVRDAFSSTLELPWLTASGVMITSRCRGSGSEKAERIPCTALFPFVYLTQSEAGCFN